MNYNISHETQVENSIAARYKKIIATGVAALAIGSVISGCESSKATDSEAAPEQVRSFMEANLAKDYVAAYTCSIDTKKPLTAIAAMADESKHLFFPGYVQVSLNLKPTTAGKEVIKRISNDASIVTLSDSVAKDDKDNVKAPLFSTKPFDTVLPEDTPLAVSRNDYKNQQFTINKDGSAVLKSAVQYLFDDKGETKDVDISIIQELYAKDEVNAYLTRGRVACGTIHFDKKAGWKVANKPVSNPVVVTDHVAPLSPRLKK